MNTQPEIILQKKLKRWSGYLATVVILVAVLVLAGWQFNISILKRPIPSLVAMNPMTAVSFLLSGFALLWSTGIFFPQKPVAGKALASIVIVIGGLKILDVLFNINTNIDQLLYHDKLKEDIIGIIPNGMAPNTAACFIFCGTSVLLINFDRKKKTNPSQYLALLTGFTGLLSLLGYVYQVQAFYGVLVYIPMALHTSFCFLLFSVAILFACPGKGFMREMTSGYSGGLMARILMPAAIIIPVIIGLLRLRGSWAGLYSDEFGSAIFALSVIIIFLVLIWYNAILLNRRDQQKKQTEDELKRSEGQITAIFNNAPDAIVVINSTGKIIKWNPEAERLFGWREPEVINKTLAETIIPEELRETHQKGLQRFLHTGTSTILEKNIDLWALKKDGGQIDIAIRISPMIIGTQQFFVGFIRDISDRKIMEKKLRSFNEELVQQVEEKTKELREILERVTDGFIALDKNLNYTYVNKKIGEMTHRHPDSLIGKNVWEVFPDAVHSSTYDAFNKAIREQVYISNIDYYEPLDLWQENHIYPSPQGISVFIRDITTQKRSERRLEASERRFRGMIEQFPYPVVTYRPNGDASSVNRAWEQMWLHSRDKLKEYNIRQDPQMALLGISDCIEKAFAGELAISDPCFYDPGLTGHQSLPKWIVLTFYPLKSEEGDLLEVIAVLQDVTETRKAEEKLKESFDSIRRLTNHLQNIREEERQHIAREIHDELGQLLTVLKMDVSLLRKKIGPLSEEASSKLTDMLGVIDKTVKTVRRIASELRPTLLDDLGLVAAMEWHLEEFEKRSGIQSRFISSIREEVIPQSYKIGLFRILQESLTNVARHSGATEVSVILDVTDNGIVMSITDNGKGFDPVLARKKKTLGLIGMRERMQMIGGEYNISSIPGKGTTTEVVIPLQQNLSNNSN
jgi:PAS domain S-box-containing protein